MTDRHEYRRREWKNIWIRAYVTPDAPAIMEHHALLQFCPSPLFPCWEYNYPDWTLFWTKIKDISINSLNSTVHLWFFKCFVLLSRNSRHKTFLPIDLADEIGRRLTMGRCYLNSITNFGSYFVIKIWDFLLRRLILDEEFEKNSLMACKNCYHILMRKPIFRPLW